MSGVWRDRGERAGLVERVCAAERRARVAEAKVRELMGDTDRCSSLAARVVELEDIVERLNAKLAKKGTR